VIPALVVGLLQRVKTERPSCLLASAILSPDTMLTRRLPRSSSRPSSLFRAFTTSHRSRDPGRSPGLGDVTPDGADGFNSRQKEFRDGLEAAKKRKEQADSQLLVDSASHSPRALSSASALLQTLGLGSLSTASHAGEARQAEHDASTRRTGKLSSFIYGTPEGQQLDQEMERSFSQVLARGKYVHSIVFHDVKPDKVNEYVELVGQWYPRMANIPENKVHLVGSWRTEVGESDTFGRWPHPCIGARRWLK